MRLGARNAAIGIGLLVVVGAGAGVGGYELGLRASRTSALTPSITSATPSPTSASPVGITPVPLATPGTSSPGNIPGPRSNASWAYDAAAGKFVLYGGNVTTGNYNEFPQPLGDTWLWDGTAWTRVASSAPSQRFDAAVVYDELRKVVMLHGGGTGSGVGFNSDTWTWDGTRWLQMGPSQSPSPSDYLMYPMAFDPAIGLTVLVDATGTTAGASPVQTWTWDGSNWSQVTTTSQPSGVRSSNAAVAYDPGRRTMVYFNHTLGGQPETWVFDGRNWTQSSTTSGTDSQHYALVRDDATSNVVLFGSNGDTWTWDGSKWMPANPVHSPGQRDGMAITYDSVHRLVTLFGGATGQGAALQHHNDIWTWDGTDWTHVSGS